MPGFLLDTASKVMCAHGGQGQPILPLSRVKIMNERVVGETTPYRISGCPYQLPPPTPNPCTLALNWAREATRVKAMGVAVLLADSMATCIPNGVPTNVTQVQSRVRGV